MFSFNRSIFRRRLITIPQLLIFIVVVAALAITIDVNRRSQIGRAMEDDENFLQEQIILETTRQVALEATLAYTDSDDFVSEYARNEGGYVLPGERRVVPLVIEVTPQPTQAPPVPPDPALSARPWQAWWQLLTDRPMPARP